MPRARLALLALVVLAALLWRPAIRPAGQAALVVADVFAPGLVGAPVGAWLTPAPRVEDTRETFAGAEMRVSWWWPGFAGRHDAVMLVNGATPVGNDNAATRALGTSLARAGFLVMLPEFPFLREGRLDPAAPGLVDAAFAHLRSLPATRGTTVGAFGASVGGGVLLAAAGRGGALSEAAYLAVLGAYFDLDTYVASVVSHSQRSGGTVAPWEPSAEARERIPPAVIDAAPPAARDGVREALAPAPYAEALARFRALPAAARAVYDALSPRSVWGRIGPPVFWIHDPNDTFEPLAEAFAARDAPREGRFSLVVPRLVRHAEPGSAEGAGPLETLAELGALVAFTIAVLRAAG